jgi:hypothetical protein
MAGIIKKREEGRTDKQRAAAQTAWLEQSKGVLGTEYGNMFEAGLHGQHADYPHLHVEDLDRSLRQRFEGAEMPLIDRRIINSDLKKFDGRQDAKNFNVSYASIVASRQEDGGKYVEKVTDLLVKPFAAQPPNPNGPNQRERKGDAVWHVLNSLGHEPGDFVDRSSVWIPELHREVAIKAVETHFANKDNLAKVQGYVDHLRATRTGMETDTAVIQVIVNKIVPQTPWTQQRIEPEGDVRIKYVKRK